MNFKHENKVYTVAVAHKKDGPTVLDVPLMTLSEAEETAKYVNKTFPSQVSNLGLTTVAYNVTAVTILPPYMIDMEQEWKYVLDDHNESLYTSINTNTHSEGSI